MNVAGQNVRIKYRSYNALSIILIHHLETNLGGPRLNSPCPRNVLSPSSRLRLLLRSSLDSPENLTLRSRSPPLALGWAGFLSAENINIKYANIECSFYFVNKLLSKAKEPLMCSLHASILSILKLSKITSTLCVWGIVSKYWNNRHLLQNKK